LRSLADPRAAIHGMTAEAGARRRRACRIHCERNSELAGDDQVMGVIVSGA
jgi:hypothetical protein